jgi:hypothetical protein
VERCRWAKRYLLMPTYRITVTNQTFRSSNEHECSSTDAARKQGIRAALAIGSDEVTNGKPFFGAEVRVENGGETVGRFVVSIGSSPLQ